MPFTNDITPQCGYLSEGVMTNQLLPLLELGASDRVNKVNNDRAIETSDQGFSRTFEDAEKEITSNKPDAQTAKETNSERQEPTVKDNRSIEDKESVPTEVSSENDQNVNTESGFTATSVAEEPNDTSSDNLVRQGTYLAEGQSVDSEAGVVSPETAVIGLDVATNADLASVLEQLSVRLQSLQTTEGAEPDPAELQKLVDELFVDSSQLPVGDIASTVTEVLNNQPLTVASAAQLINDLKKYGQLAPSTESAGVRFSSTLSASPNVAPLNSDDLLAQSSILSRGLTGERLETLTLQASTDITNTTLTDKLAIDKLNFAQLLNASGVAGDSSPKLSTDISSIAALSTAQTTVATATAKPQLAIGTPFQQAQWGEAVTERVMWLSSQGLQEAEIHLNPAELGPMQVKVSVANEQAHVSFVVSNTSVREALDQNAIRLREMFDGEGINLVDVDVSDQSQQQAGNSERDTNRQGFAGEGNDPSVIEGETAISSHSNGASLLSLYA